MVIYSKVEGEVVAKCTLHLHHTDKFAQIHQEVYKWNKEVYYQLLLDFEDVKQFLRDEGIHRLVTGSVVGDKKIQKYWRMMGFFEPRLESYQGKEVMYAEMEI